MPDPPARVLFVCTGNCGRSPMAAAVFAQMVGPRAVVASAGVFPGTKLDPPVRRLMHQRGIDLSGHRPRSVRAVTDTAFDVVVTIGDAARQRTPPCAGNPTRVHWDLDDPAHTLGTPDQDRAYRKLLADIENLARKLARSLPQP